MSYPKNNNFSNVDNLGLNDSLGIQFTGGSSDPTDSDLAEGRLYYKTSVGLRIYNGTSWTTLGAGGGGTPTWETIYTNDSSFGITAGTWTISQSSANAIITLNKTNVGAGAVLDITNSGTGADIKNSTNWSIAASGGVGVLELGSGGTVNVTGGALTIGKTGTATTLAGTATIAEGFTVTSGNSTITSGNLTLTSGNLTLTSGTFTVSAGVSTMIATSNTAPTLLITNNTVTTYGSGGTSTGMVLIRSTSLTSGTALRVQLTEGTLNGGFYFDAWDVTGGSAVFSVAEDGVTAIAGVGGSNVLTLTAGDMLMSDGSITVTDADDAATLSITNNSAATATMVAFAGSGTFTGTTTTSFLTLTASGLTSGTVAYIPAAALTTGKVLDITATAATDGILLNVTGGGANMTATGRMLKLAMGAATVGQGIELSTTGVYTGAGVVTVTADSATTSGVTVGQGIVAVSADGLTTGTALDVTSTSIVLTTGRLFDFSHISGNITGTLNKSGDLASIVSTRTVTTGTVADDFDMASFVRTSIINGAGSFSSTGSVLYVENVVTNTSGTVTDTANGIQVVMDVDGTGDALNITHNAVAGKAVNITSAADAAAGVILVTANSLTTGQMLKLTTSATAITGAGRIFLSNHSGATGGSAVLNEFISAANDETVVLQVKVSDALALGKLVNISGVSVTTGTLLDISDNTAHTTGTAVNIVTNSADTGTRTLLNVKQDHASATGATAVAVTQDSTGAALSITSTATTGKSILITGSQTTQTAGVVDITVASLTTGTVIDIGDADGLTTGKILNLVSNSSDTSARNLVFIHNDHASANAAVPLALRNDAAVSTNYFKIMTWTNGANTNTLWMGNGTTANGNLTGTLGDLIINAGSNKPEYCTSNPTGTAWTALV